MLRVVITLHHRHPPCSTQPQSAPILKLLKELHKSMPARSTTLKDIKAARERIDD